MKKQKGEDILLQVLIQWCMMLLWIFGVIKIAEILCIWFHRPPHPPKLSTILPLQGHIDDPETLLLYFECVSMWSSENQSAIVLDAGMDAESAKACRKFCQKSRLTYCGKEEIQEICKAPKDKVY